MSDNERGTDMTTATKTASHYEVVSGPGIVLSIDETLQDALDYYDLHGLTPATSKVWVVFADGSSEQVA